MHRGTVALTCCHQCVSHLMIRDDALLVDGNCSILSLVSGNDNLHALLKICLSHKCTALTDCPQCAFIDDIGELCTAGTGSCASDGVKVNITSKLYILCMNLQDCHTALQIWKLYRDPPVKTARSKECLVQRLRTVGCCQNDNTLAAIKAVHLGQQLV